MAVSKNKTRRRRCRHILRKDGGAPSRKLTEHEKQEIATFLRNKNRTNQMEITWSHLEGIPITSDMSFKDVIIRDSIVDGFSYAASGNGADLRGINFLNTRLVNCDFTGANLEEMTIVNQNMPYDLNTPTIANCKFDGANLDGIYTENITIKNTSFRGANLSLNHHPYFEIRSMVNVSFAGADLTRGMFVNTKNNDFLRAAAYNVDFTDAKLNETKFIDLEFHRSKFSGADLTAAEFDNCFVDAKTNATITTDREDIYDQETVFKNATPASFGMAAARSRITPQAVPVNVGIRERFAFQYGPEGPERDIDDTEFVPAAKMRVRTPSAQQASVRARRTTSDLSPATTSPVVAQRVSSLGEDEALFGMDNAEYYDFGRQRPIDIVRARKIRTVRASPYSASKMSRRRREYAANVIQRAVKTRRLRRSGHGRKKT